MRLRVRAAIGGAVGAICGAALLATLSGCVLSSGDGEGEVRDSASMRGAAHGASRTELVAFDTSPFPYEGDIPDQNTHFLNINNGERRGHASPRGSTYWLDQTYSDKRVLLSIPHGFSLRRPAAIVVYFHGNRATLERDVRDRQGVPRQLAESGLNAVLVAPQFAVDARDSSAGHFWEPGTFNRFLDEAADRLARESGHPDERATFAALPVILVAYSGGYLAAAYALDVGGAGSRIKGVVLMDALYGETERFHRWIQNRDSGAFVSAYSRSSRSENEALQQELRDDGISFSKGLPARLGQGSVTFIDVGDAVEHNDFVTRAWTGDPLEAVLARTAALLRS